MAVIKWMIAALLALGIGAFVYFDLSQYFSLSAMNAWTQASPLQATAVFLSLYLFVATMNLPGTGPLTFIAGAAFGFIYGALLVSFAGAVGATLAMLIARTLLQDWVQRKFPKVISRMNHGIADDGRVYLFTIRMVPVIPYFLVNMAFGLSKMRTWTFYWVTQLGMLPITFLYVNAGAKLGELDQFSLLGVFNWQVILSLVGLVAVPIIIKLAMQQVPAFNRIHIEETDIADARNLGEGETT